MKHLFYLIIFMPFVVISCSNKDLDNLDDLVGTWNLTSTSGGLHGDGYDAPFDNMTIKSDLTFQLNSGNSEIAFGKIEEKTSDTEDAFVQFNSESEVENLYDITEDGEKYIQFEGNNIMHLQGPCCDRYNSHWEKD